MISPLGLAPPMRAREVPKVLLGFILQSHLSGTIDVGTPVPVHLASPWDLWWAAYRAGIPFAQLGVEPIMPYGACRTCVADAHACASADPPRHPDELGDRPCRCQRLWAIRMREGGERTRWPGWSLTIALVKPGAPTGPIRARLEAEHDVLDVHTRVLTPADTRRMYPDAYGEDFIAAVDTYLTSGPVTVMLLRSHTPQTGAEVKDRIRQEFGDAKPQNHLHMPDNPGEALADIAHLAGWLVLQEHYERAETNDEAAARMAFYRAALGVRNPNPDGAAAA
ncbi:hypothetical protein ACIBEJ_00570 [Nonomuraea sp. NPDC050790]|uniref:hypothetical protein n=1 Tax=Nonomuraea sp. NPDC050790 TaxID=3364371 RepID=UPI0037BB67A5